MVKVRRVFIFGESYRVTAAANNSFKADAQKARAA